MTTRSPGWRVRKSPSGGWSVQRLTGFGWANHSHFSTWAGAMFYANLLAN